MPLYEITDAEIRTIEKTTFEAARLRERDDLQRLLRRRIDVVVPGGYVLAEEFADWDDSIRRIDLLVLDRDANLVVVELKRTTDGGHMELQALRYAAMVSTMTWSQAVDAHRQYLLKLGSQDDPQSRLLEFLGWSEPDDERFARDVRIVLASADFSKELTTTVLWLNERGLDVRCVRLVPYNFEGRVLLDVQPAIPLPEAEEYQIKVKEKSAQERFSRRENSGREQQNLAFWSRLLQKANEASPLHRNVSPSRGHWIGTSTCGLGFNYITARDSARVDLYLSRPNAEENKRLFDELYARRSEIEQAYGGPLLWQRLDGKTACRIAAEVDAGSPRDESAWDDLHDAMVAAMQRFHAAFSPHLDRIREG